MSGDAKHSPEPWEAVTLMDDPRTYAGVYGAFPEDVRERLAIGGIRVAPGHFPLLVARFQDPESALRAAACVNACAGISTEALEAGALGKALDGAAREHDPRTREIENEDHTHCPVCAALRALGRLKP